MSIWHISDLNIDLKPSAPKFSGPQLGLLTPVVASPGVSEVIPSSAVLPVIAIAIYGPFTLYLLLLSQRDPLMNSIHL